MLASKAYELISLWSKRLALSRSSNAEPAITSNTLAAKLASAPARILADQHGNMLVDHNGNLIVYGSSHRGGSYSNFRTGNSYGTHK
jgi:hypothetical protein